MHRISDLERLRAVLAHWRGQGERIALVPTMGNLHTGHLALVEAATRRADRVVVSLFVNPTQFGPGEDFDSYPRTLEDDLARLVTAGCDLVWLPAVSTMYPLDSGFGVTVPAMLADTLCGEFRPGHFDGVASVVLRLFNQVRPRLAMFGEKDFQQLLVIRRLVTDLALEIDVLGWPTQRESDGLALSSRNQYLTPEERAVAPLLFQTLTDMAGRLKKGDQWEELEAEASDRLERAGFRPQYLAWRSAEDLGDPQPGCPQRLLAAAWLGKARLIDNIDVKAGL